MFDKQRDGLTRFNLDALHINQNNIFKKILKRTKIPDSYFFRFEIDLDDGPVFAGGLDGDLIGDEAGQERPVGASEQGHGSAASPEQKGRSDVAEKLTRLE